MWCADVVRRGAAWRLLPHDWPPWQTVDHSGRAWRTEGTGEQIHPRRHEEAGGGAAPDGTRANAPWGQQRPPVDHDHGTGGATAQRRLRRGQAAEGTRKRHRLLDTQGGVLKARGSIPPTGPTAPGGASCSKPSPICGSASRGGDRGGSLPPRAASSSTGSCRPAAGASQWARSGGREWDPAGCCRARPCPNSRRTGVPLLPGRWIGERTVAGLGRSRRLSKDDEFLPATGAAMISLAMSRLMRRRLAQTP